MENLNQNPSSSESDNQPLNLPTTSPDTAQLSNQNNVTNPTEPQVINPQGNTGQSQPTVYGVPPNPNAQPTAVVVSPNTDSSTATPSPSVISSTSSFGSAKTSASKLPILIASGAIVVVIVAVASYFLVFHKSKTPTNSTTSVQNTNQSSSSGSDSVANGVSVASTFLNDATHNEASSAWNLLEPQTATALNETQSQFTQNVQQLSSAFTGQIKETNSKQSQLPAQDGQEIPMLNVSFSLDLKGQSAGSNITESYISKANGGNNTWEVDYCTFTNYSFTMGYSTSNQL